MSSPTLLGVNLLYKPDPDIDTLLCSIGLECVKSTYPNCNRTVSTEPEAVAILLLHSSRENGGNLNQQKSLLKTRVVKN